MKFFSLLLLATLLFSCGTKVPYTNEVRDEFELNTDKKMAGVQFYTSSDIVMEKSKSSGNQGTTDDGVLVTTSSKNEDRITIVKNTPCIFEGYGPNGELKLRFEEGSGRVITFAVRPNQSASKKYFLVAEWDPNKGGKIEYGGDVYYANASSGSAYIQVVLKNLQKTKRKSRVVKGMKV